MPANNPNEVYQTLYSFLPVVSIVMYFTIVSLLVFPAGKADMPNLARDIAQAIIVACCIVQVIGGVFPIGMDSGNWNCSMGDVEGRETSLYYAAIGLAALIALILKLPRSVKQLAAGALGLLLFGVPLLLSLLISVYGLVFCMVVAIFQCVLGGYIFAQYFGKTSENKVKNKVARSVAVRTLLIGGTTLLSASDLLFWIALPCVNN